MTDEEKLYTDTIFTHLDDEIDLINGILFTPSCSSALRDAIRIHFNIDQSMLLTDDNTTAEANATYSLIVSFGGDIDSIQKIDDYSSILQLGGILAIEADNNSYLQTRRKTSPHLLHPNHTLDKLLAKYGLSPVFREAVGKFNRLHSLPMDGLINKFLHRFGKAFPNSRLYSPYFVLIYRRQRENHEHTRYISENSLPRRLSRIRERTAYKIKNHKINDYIIATVRLWYRFVGVLENIFFVHRYRFHKNITPSIYTHPRQRGKKTLVIAMTYLQIGGVERVMLNIIKGLNRSKFTILLLTTTPSNNPWHNEFLQHVDHIVHIPSLLDETWPEKYRRQYVEQYVIKNSADVLFMTNSSAAYHATPVIKKNLSSIRIYDLLHTHGTPKDNDAYLKISMPFDTFINRRIVIDEYLKTYYLNKYPVQSEKIAVIYNGIDLESLNSQQKQNDSLLANIPAERRKITFVGRLEEDKSPTRLVDIAIKLKDSKIPASIVVVGNGTLGPNMIKKATENNVINDYIFFYGQSDNPLPLAEQSDFTILVSNAEGIPMSVLESMSVGTPAIASAVGGIPEIIDHNQNGILVSILDLKNEDEKNNAFVEAISDACKLRPDAYISLQSSAKDKINKRFANMPEIYEHLFETGRVSTEESSKGK